MIAIAFVCLFISKFKPLASIERVLLLAFIWCSCEFRRFHFAIAIFQCVHIGQISIGFICRGSIPTLLSHRIRPPSSIRHHQQMHRSDASCISLEISFVIACIRACKTCDCIADCIIIVFGWMNHDATRIVAR